MLKIAILGGDHGHDPRPELREPPGAFLSPPCRMPGRSTPGTLPNASAPKPAPPATSFSSDSTR